MRGTTPAKGRPTTGAPSFLNHPPLVGGSTKFGAQRRIFRGGVGPCAQTPIPSRRGGLDIRYSPPGDDRKSPGRYIPPMTSLADVRTSFTDFFRDRQHQVVPSSPLVPRNDPTL